MSEIKIYKSPDNQIEINVQFENDTVWLTQENMAVLFNQTKRKSSYQ
jgi:hypothetical protein